MADRFVETERKGWFSRMGSSLAGVLIGLLLFVIAFPVLFWNEGRAVRRAKDLAHGQDAVVSVKPDRPDPKNDGKLVHVAGAAKATKPAADPIFGVGVQALKLQRNVEMYQWKEKSTKSKKENVGGSETTKTEYTYEKVWSSTHLDSGNFKIPAGHQNPGSMPYESAAFVPAKVKLGGFVLASSFLDELQADTRLDAKASKLPPGGVQHGGGIYIGDPATAAIGDVRITFEIAPEGVLTVVGAQKAGELGPYKDAEMSGSIELLERGKKSSEEMFQSAQDQNFFLTWILRLVGFLMMFGGLRLAARPLSVLGSIIPFVGKAIGFGTGIVAFFVALALSAVTIGIAWLFYRPLLAIALFGGGIAAIVLAVVAVKKASDG